MATLFSIFESTPGDVLREALKTSNGELDQAIPWILSHNSSSVQDVDSNPNTLPTSKSTPFSSSLSTPARKKQKLIQPRLSAFMPTPSSLSVFKPGISPASSHQHNSSSSTNNNNSVDAPSSSNETTFPSLPSLNDRLRWKEPPLTFDPTATSIDSTTPSSSTPAVKLKPPKPLILYSPEDVAKHCPCTLIFNVLDKDLANRLLKSMLIDSETWNRNRWWLFERMVESPHKTSYFAERDDDMEEVAGWTYNGKKQDPPRRFLPEMEEAKLVVRRIVNELRKERDIHPYEVQGDWNCNVAAVNHYAHSKESVGFHADKLTYLGPRPTIGSLTLGVTRFFRIRKVIPDATHPDTAGQLISIALPHNSLCIMWPPMQEEWKHEVPPQPTVTPHPISGTARINITFRLRREGFSPQETPVCKCGVAMVLRCVFKNKANYGRYFYMCYAAGSKMGQTCGQFSWVDMEQKLGLLSPPGAGGSDAGTDDQGTVSKNVQREEQQQEISATNDFINTTTESEGRSSKHPRSPNQDQLLEQVDNNQESDLNLTEELQEDDTALLEQQWEAIEEADDPTSE
ncbi:hypothetical protein EC957_001233 [Mortierella hygrophila]|uniref:Fe2OG dioxygenase domain-containing protein n=1 Tax=Mortierella hygrophila TaxID=979708 RepID=A0A9P6F6S7_9FUNG|nr:hypothetical protein EC957_001233 [Mortierella hygrophila]